MRAWRVVRIIVTMSLATLSSVPLAHAGGDTAAGKAKSVACEACHTAIPPASDTPHLAGQRASYIAKQLKAFKAGDRKHPSMNAIAAQLGDADIDNLAAYWSSQPAGSDTTLSEAAAAIRNTHMVFPKDFPNGFTLYLTSNDATKKTVSKTYINSTGWKAAQASKPLPDGTTIVTVHSSAKLDAEQKPVVQKDGSWAINKVESYAGMEMRAAWGKDIPELLRNDGWNYAVFAPDKTPRPGINQTACLACHKPQAAVGYVFTFQELQSKATGR